uniref:C2H2-type domain-containing protein n=1 Tax=Parascaris univalens TaxID=6257 RepID=A0A915AAD6_PARUN
MSTVSTLMYNRIRGFHILWHMAKDLGINRYACKFCEFGHDRSQSVQTHGKREHGVEDCVEDRIEEYSDEVKSMSEACFGFQALFSQDSRRRSKIPIALPRAETLDDVIEGSEGGLSMEHNEDDEELEEHDHEGDTEHEINDEREDHETNEDALDDDNKEEERQEVLPSTGSCRTPSATTIKVIPSSTPKSETLSSVTSVSSSTSSHRSRKTKNRRFGIRKPPSRLKRKEMARLREMSMKLGGAQYFKKRINEAAHCEKCGVQTTSRMSDHAYRHMDAQLFLCPHCDLGNQSRELVVRHIRDMHDSTEHPIDDRLKYAAEIKEMIRQCYPAYFVDAPIPTAADIEKLKASLEMDDCIKGDREEAPEDESNEHEAEDEEHDAEESGEEGDRGGGDEMLHDDDEIGHEGDESGHEEDKLDDGDDEHHTIENEDDVVENVVGTRTATGEEDEEIEAEM